MRPHDDDGNELNAEFTVIGDGGHTSLVLESAGGRTRHGVGSRNIDYVPALRLLLGRLARRRAVLHAAVVVSTRLVELSEGERTVLTGPIELADVTDVEKLRLDITRGQGRVGLPEGATKEGNNRKRILLRLTVPGYGPEDAERLEVDLAKPGAEAKTGRWDAHEVLRELVGVEIYTVSGRPNMVLRASGGTMLVRTERSPEGQLVDVGEVQRGLDLLAEHGLVRVSVDELGHRSAFVGAVLATLPAVHVTLDPAVVRLEQPAFEEVAADRDFGELDSLSQVKIRREQTMLRNLLVGDRAIAACALCGQDYPIGFLVAAHIKKRAVCTEDERRDLRNVAMLACTFGCDALYESGWITVDATGRIEAATADALPPAFHDRLRQLVGSRCPAHHALSEKYFAWHRTSAFRGDTR